MKRLSVIAPCLNEQDNVNKLVGLLLSCFNKNSFNGEIILVDDGSSDKTWDFILEAQAEYPAIVNGVRHKKNLGIVESWSSGLNVAKGELIVTIDADMQYSVSDIVVLYNHLIKGHYDLVQGWRKVCEDGNLFRLFLSRALSVLLKGLFKISIHDVKSGFVIYKREVFEEILEDRSFFNYYQHFFSLCALKKGFKFSQVPIVFHCRLKGQSFISNSLLFSLKVLWEIPKAMCRYSLWFNNFKRNQE